MKKSILLAALILGTIMSLSACGKMSNNEPIEGSGYPHVYPRR